MIEDSGEKRSSVDDVAEVGRTILVGVKLDAPSRELLTWALVKVAEPGDTVIALHILGNEIVDRAGNSSLLSLVKTFDSVLDVYEGFCNLKQVDLKLKLCRGSCARKIIVREAKSFSASKVLVGISKSHHTIRSSASVAKYIAKKLSKDCWVIAVNNGKIMFQKEGSPLSTTNQSQDVRRITLLNVLQRSVTLNKTTKVVSHSEEDSKEDDEVQSSGQNLRQALAAARFENCAVCGSNSLSPNDTTTPGKLSGASDFERSEDDGDDECHKELEIVPVNGPEDTGGSVTMLVRKLPESRPGWPLLRRAVSTLGQSVTPHRSLSKQIPVVQWALKLPPRESKELGYDSSEDNLSSLNTIVPFGINSITKKSFPDNSPRKLPEELEGLFERFSSTCRFFKYKELVSLTSNFSADNFIGRGGSSRVFRGCLSNGRVVAVKILKQTEDVLNDFVAEIEIITTLHHKNIISLLGFCFEDHNLLLVYNYLSRGSLEENLHGNKKDPHAFCWSERYKVAVGVAEALNYLHNSASQPVIHRDVKSSNILLSDDFEPQLSDFGLARWASISTTHMICSDVAGTFGYLAPEYFMYGKVNDKIDVYAFGVVLLELLSGRKPISSGCPKGQESLVMWAKPILDDGKYSQLLDPSLRDNNNNKDQMQRMALAATLCIRRSPQARPKMSIVLKLLKGDEDTHEWARQQVSSSSGESKMLKDEQCQRSNLQTHLNVALLDVEDDSISMGSIEQGVSVEDYLKGRTSRSSSFD
ncbi:probable receptor-like serine/threonine-protein kinase At5g57670 isoform X2 [Capsella rubella]|uniref:probable receptor-like serine/threonine-protein kinase At5g57670 isoform X2 n=1 Tax=Capsella rubella TaxID=81985 RepID=UPI000CD4B81A|nr:probable receptor-like serine/threonine-protein kinase At5g57670 isoform X2 [Capsella rubella]